jgi:hypothetical protein
LAISGVLAVALLDMDLAATHGVVDVDARTQFLPPESRHSRRRAVGAQNPKATGASSLKNLKPRPGYKLSTRML